MRAQLKYVHGLPIVPSWRTPHHFHAFRESLGRWFVDVSGEPEQDAWFVFTSGLLVHDVAAADLSTPDGVLDLGDRVGFEWLGSYADALLKGSPRGRKPSPLTKWTKSKCGILAPGQPSSTGVLGEPLPSSIPAATLDAFASLGLEGTLEKQRLEPFVRELVRAAKRREAPKPTDEQLDYIRSRVLLDGAGFRSTTAGWALEFPNLQARILFELFELFEVRPPLHLCPLCGRVYVPRTAAQRRCTRGLYTWPGGIKLRACVPRPRLDADEHRREYKRLAEALRRTRLRHGDQSPKTRTARAELDAYRQAHYGRVGRPPKEKPVVLTEGRQHG